MRGFVLRFVVTGVAVLVAVQVIPGLAIDSFAAGAVGVLVLAILNAVVRPLLYLLSAPFIIVTLGLFMIVIMPSCCTWSPSWSRGFMCMVSGRQSEGPC